MTCVLRINRRKLQKLINALLNESLSEREKERLGVRTFVFNRELNNESVKYLMDLWKIPKITLVERRGGKTKVYIVDLPTEPPITTDIKV